MPSPLMTRFKVAALNAAAPGVVARKRWGEVQTDILRFNTLAQSAYDSSVRWQRLGVAGNIMKGFAKATLKEVVANAVSTFGPGALVDVEFGNVAKHKGAFDVKDGWSQDNVMGKGWDYTLGDDGGHSKAGDSGMSRLTENSIKAGIGFILGIVQDKVTDKITDDSDTNAEARIKAYIENKLWEGAIPGARGRMIAMPDLKSANSTVLQSTAAHQAQEREGTGSLIKEAVHQIDQLCYAINDLNTMMVDPDTFQPGNTRFRKCREMVEFMAKMYWFRRKYNKTRHFLKKLRDDYAALGMVLQEMEKFWRTNVREFEFLAMRTAALDASISESSGARVQLVTDLGRHGGTQGEGNLTSGERNWRTVTTELPVVADPRRRP